MGLTIHYSLGSTAPDVEIPALVESIRQLALDLPFEEVAEIICLEGEDCEYERYRGVDEEKLWLLIQACQHVALNNRSSASVVPVKVIAFEILPGPGSEPLNIGICRYPATLRIGHRTFKTKLTGWRWSSFCKTQYASNPDCGGIANFLRCHISAITLLERIGELPTLKVRIDDEGRYGPSRYSDDWREANAAGTKPTYRWHKGRYDPKALADEVGSWNEMVAGFFGALADRTKGAVGSPIASFPNFEHLEFKGSQDDRLNAFLDALRSVLPGGSGA